MRKINANSKYPLEESKKLLHTSRLPDVLLNREEQCKLIKQFIQNGVKLHSSSSRVLCISGVPGTGKTASVMKVVMDLKNLKSTTKFKFCNINGLELADPKFLFLKVYKFVREKGEKKTPKDAQQYLNEYFQNDQKKKLAPIVILIDEVDMLYTKREDVIYTVFNWTSMEDSRCCVIAISNTLDLAERKFSQRIVSRMGSNKLTFQPYEFHEIERILRRRLEECPSIADKTIELTSKKVASISGDLRKAFELVRRAIDLALEKCEEQGQPKDTLKLLPEHILEAIRESTTSIRLEFIQVLSKHQELLFRSLVSDLYQSALEDTDFSRVLFGYKRMCPSEGIKSLPLPAAFQLMEELAESHLVILSTGRGQLHCQVKLGFPLSEAQFCLRQLDLLKNNQQAQHLLPTVTPLSASKSATKSPKRQLNLRSGSPNTRAATTQKKTSRKIDFDSTLEN